MTARAGPLQFERCGSDAEEIACSAYCVVMVGLLNPPRSTDPAGCAPTGALHAAGAPCGSVPERFVQGEIAIDGGVLFMTSFSH